ncbi:MAG: M28 family peptidase [Bacteroidaceae bacterium]|nr:M28 family peptidase [Bacteroidaceae bacterium]
MAKIKSLLLVFMVLFSVSCKMKSQKPTAVSTSVKEITPPLFNADSAYHFVAQQVDFGSRVPNSKAHQACGDYLVDQLTKYGAKVYQQKDVVMGYDGKQLQMRNIIGSYNDKSFKRVLLAAHWDTRPWADNDPNPANHHTPILGANDGASGVGLLLEVARLLQLQQPNIGIDIIFFDLEDYGTPQFAEGPDQENTWCLGSQYWANHPHKENYNARYGILLDMVGGKNATFFKEGISVEKAPGVVDKVWSIAESLGHGAFFVNRLGSYVTDDHLYVNQLANIPCIDVIAYEEHNQQSSFGSFWHTLNDNMDVIDKSTLKAVGETITAVIYKEK